MFGGERYGKRIPNERESRVIELVAQGLKNRKLLTRSELPSMSSKTTSESSMTNSDSGTESNLLSGTKPASTSKSPKLDQFEELESWEHSILGLEQTSPSHHN